METRNTQQPEITTVGKVLARIDIIAAFFISLIVAAIIVQIVYDEFNIALILPGLAYIAVLIIVMYPAVKAWHWTIGLMLAIIVGIFVALVRPRR